MILEKIIKYLIYISFSLPLIFLNYSIYPLHFGKTVYFQILVEVLLVLASLYFVFYKKSLRKFLLIDWLILAFFLSQLISAIFGINFNNSFWGDQQRASGVFTWAHFIIFYFLIRQFFITKKDWLNAGFLIVFVSLISSIIAWIGQSTDLLKWISVDSDRLMGVIGNPIFFANYLTIPIFLAFTFFFWSLSNSKISDSLRIWHSDSKLMSWMFGKHKWFYLIVGISSLTTFFIAQVRGAFVGLLVALFLIWLFVIFGKVLSKKASRSILAVGLIFSFVFSGLYILNKKSDLISTYSSGLSRMLSIDSGSSTGKTRLMAWDIAIKGWQEYPVIGYGPENYQDIFDKYYNPDFLRYSFAETVWDKPHNYFLEILGAQGVVGVLLYLGIILTAIFYLKSIFKREIDKYGKIGVIILFGAITAYVVQGLFSFETSNSLQLWFFLLAFIVFLYARKEGENFIKEKNELFGRVVAFCFLIVVIFSLYQNYIMLKSSYYMSFTRDAVVTGSAYYWKKYATEAISVKAPFVWENAIFLTKDISTFDGNGNLNADMLYGISGDIEKVFLDYVEKYPNSYLYRFWLGQLYAFMGEYMDKKYYDNSERFLKEAGEISKDRQHIPLLLSKSYLLRGMPKEAIVILEALVAKNREFPEPHWFLGLAYIGNNEKEKGILEMERGLSFGSTQEGNILYFIDLYLEKEDYKKALPLYKKLTERSPENASFHHDLAIMYMVTGNKDASVKSFKDALRLNPTLKDGIEKFFKVNNVDINLLK
ncbi:MAG: O-antigen ligase family protein [Patescibacteria group bacterium]